MEEKRIIEVNGVKLEVDLRSAKVVDSYRVGDNVKVLVKKYSDSYESHVGVIVGFDNFPSRPTIVIAYLESSYTESVIKFLYLNKDSKDVEVCQMLRDENIICKSDVVSRFDKMILDKEKEIEKFKTQREYFLTNFEKHFGDSAT